MIYCGLVGSFTIFIFICSSQGPPFLTCFACLRHYFVIKSVSAVATYDNAIERRESSPLPGIITGTIHLPLNLTLIALQLSRSFGCDL